MAYYLAVERTPGSHEAINIKKTEKGRKLFPNDTAYECTLEEIDRLTTEYISLFSLNHMLRSEKKTPWTNCSLSIVHVNGMELKITKNILLSDSKKYLDNPSLVLEYLIDKFTSLDTDFSNQLAKFLQEEANQKILEKITLSMEKCIINSIPLELIETTNIAKILLYRTNQDGVILEPISFDYEKLHNIVAFITDYERELNKQDEQVIKRTKTKNT